MTHREEVAQIGIKIGATKAVQWETGGRRAARVFAHLEHCVAPNLFEATSSSISNVFTASHEELPLMDSFQQCVSQGIKAIKVANSQSLCGMRHPFYFYRLSWMQVHPLPIQWLAMATRWTILCFSFPVESGANSYPQHSVVLIRNRAERYRSGGKYHTNSLMRTRYYRSIIDFCPDFTVWSAERTYIMNDEEASDRQKESNRWPAHHYRFFNNFLKTPVNTFRTMSASTRN